MKLGVRTKTRALERLAVQKRNEIALSRKNFQGNWELTCSYAPMCPGLALKRAIDIIGATVGLLLLLPVFIAISVLIKIDSPGPVVFTQKRIGKNGRAFTLYKFRSMYADCDESVHRDYMARLIAAESDDSLRGKGGCFKIEDDPRVTRVGRFLRKSSLDELPQLLNVLRGEMSLIGPRPAIQYEVEMYDDWHMRRLAVKPGITGYWQVSGRSETDFNGMVRLDLEYLDNWSLLLDLKILVNTLRVVFSKKGAW